MTLWAVKACSLGWSNSVRQLKRQGPRSKVSMSIVTGPAKGAVCGLQVVRCPFSVFDFFLIIV